MESQPKNPEVRIVLKILTHVYMCARKPVFGTGGGGWEYLNLL